MRAISREGLPWRDLALTCQPTRFTGTFRNYQLMSLWDMRDFEGREIVVAVNGLAWASVECIGISTTPPVPPSHQEVADKAGQAVARARALCQKLGLKTAEYEAEFIEHMLNDPQSTGQISGLLTNLVRLIGIEAHQRKFLVMPPEMADLYDAKTPLLGEPIPTELADLTYDLTEAAKCLALDRTTACVFHLCLAMEFATEKLRAKVGAGRGPSGTMGDLVSEIEKVVKGWDVKGGAVTKAKQDGYLEAVWHLRAFVKGMRNQELHRVTLCEVYKLDEARCQFQNVKTFLIELVALLRMP